MPNKVSIRADPRWHKFIARYRDEMNLFAREACNIVSTDQQQDLFNHMSIVDNWVSVSSGTGTGKSSGTACVMLCFILTYPESRVLLTANKVQQVQIGVFKYLKEYWKRIIRRFPWLDDYFTLTDTVFYANESKGVWETVIKGYRVGQEESLAGEHAEHMLYIVDEASGLGDAAFEKITGTLTQDDNRLLLLSQPTRNEGFFYRSHHDLAREKGGSTAGTFQALVFNSELSPLVKAKFLLAKYLEYGGRKSAEYMIRVLGQFCDNLSGYLISRSHVDAGFKAKIEHEEDWGYVIVCDVAGGQWRDSCVYAVGRVSGRGETRNVEVIDWKEMDGDVGAVDFANHVYKELLPNYPNATIGVDSGSMGIEMINQLKRLNAPRVTSITWGNPMHSNALKKRFKNKRAYACTMVRDALNNGRLKLYDAGKRMNQKLTNQFIKIPFKYNDSGLGLQIQIQGKDEMKKNGITSPDIFDTHAFFYIVDYVAVPTDLEQWQGDPDNVDELADLDDELDEIEGVLSF